MLAMLSHGISQCNQGIMFGIERVDQVVGSTVPEFIDDHLGYAILFTRSASWSPIPTIRELSFSQSSSMSMRYSRVRSPCSRIIPRNTSSASCSDSNAAIKLCDRMSQNSYTIVVLFRRSDWLNVIHPRQDSICVRPQCIVSSRLRGSLDPDTVSYTHLTLPTIYSV